MKRFRKASLTPLKSHNAPQPLWASLSDETQETLNGGFPYYPPGSGKGNGSGNGNGNGNLMGGDNGSSS